MSIEKLAVDLSAHFTLVRVSISMWGNSRQQKDIAQEVEASKGATIGKALKVGKILFDADALKPCATARNAIATKWRELTSVWGDDSWRLLPTSKWVEYGNTMQPLFAEFEKQADLLTSRFDDLLLEAQTRLNGLFDRGDYPSSAADFRAKFAIGDHSRSIETADDAKRIKSLPADVVERIERSMNQQLEQNVTRLQVEAFDRLHTVTAALSKSLVSWKDGEQKSFKATLWDTVSKACNFCQQFNITGDAHMSALVEDIRNQLLRYDADDVRENPAKAGEIIIAANTLADKAAKRRAAMANMSGYMQ